MGFKGKGRNVSILKQLAAFVCEARGEDFSASVRATARLHAADAILARFAGQRMLEGRHITALTAGGGVDAELAALSALVRVTECDDIHLLSGATPSSVSVPIALGLMREFDCDPARFESAFFVGTELMVRFAMALGGANVFYRGVWPTRTGAPLCVAATAARMMGLPQEQTANALSLAALMSARQSGRFSAEPSGRWILLMGAIRDGLLAVRAAAAGFSADRDVLEGDWLNRVFNVQAESAQLTKNPGESSVYAQMSMKPYCTARQALPAAEAMLELVDEGLDVASVRKIEIRAPSAYLQMISTPLNPAVRASTYVSAAGQVALAARNPRALYDVERKSALEDTAVIEFAKLCTVTSAPELDALYPAQWPAEIIVTATTGEARKLMTDPRGSPARPLGAADVLEKARRIFGFLDIHPSHADALMKMSLEGFEDQAALGALAAKFWSGELAAVR